MRIAAKEASQPRVFLKEVRILKSMRNKDIVVMKAVCENPLAVMLEYVFFNFTPFGLEGCVSSLQDDFDYIPAREETVSSFAFSHNKIVPHVK